MKWFGKYMSGLENYIVQDRHFETEAKTKISSAETKTARPRPQKIGLERSRDQDRGLEDYKTASTSRAAGFESRHNSPSKLDQCELQDVNSL